MTMESHVVVCRQCHRTRVVAVSDLRPPCFRNVEEQADCPEILQRRDQGDETLLTMMCGALAGSFAENLQHAVVEVVDREGDWQVACRVPGDSDRFYSSAHARWQGEIWGRWGRTGLARRFREAAKEADQASRSRRRMRRLVPILALGLVVAAVGAARSLLTWSTRQPTEIAMQAKVSWAEQQSIAVAGMAASDAPAPRPLAEEPPSSATGRTRARGSAFTRGCAIGARGGIDRAGASRVLQPGPSHRRQRQPSTMLRRLSPHRRRSLSLRPKWYRFRVAH